MKFLSNAESRIGAGLSVFSFAVYAFTACPSIDVIDAGELSTVAYTLGISHPTGYPLFSIFGAIISHIPVPVRIVHRVNLMAALFCAVAVYVFFRFLFFFLSEFILSRNERVPGGDARRTDIGGTIPLLSAACGTLLLAFSETFWAQATSVEVYSLHLLLISIVLLVFTRAISLRKAQEDGGMLWYLFAFTLGLAFCNHMTTILLAPAFLFAYFYTHRFTAASWEKLLRLVPFFLVGLSLYLYLPIRAATRPIMDWGNPVSFERLFWHFSGKQYRIWLFSSTESAAKQLSYFIDTLPAEFVYFPLAFALIGIWRLFRERKIVLVFTLLLFIGCVLYSINYDIHDIDSYFLLAYLTLAVWAAAGISWILTAAKVRMIILAPAAILVCLVPLIVNYPEETERDFHLVEDYTKDIFHEVQPNGIILSYQWDYFVSAANYLQMVEGERPDVVVIDKELLRRSWYFVQLETRYPTLVERSRPEIDNLLKELYKFEHDLPYDPEEIERAYTGVIRSFVVKNIAERPIYVTPEVEPQYLRGFNLVPIGLAARIYPDTLRHQTACPEFHYSIPVKTSKYTEGILSLYARADVNCAMYKNMLGERDSALVLVDRALQISPGMNEAMYLKEQLQNR